jgi:thiamine biosynthesis lipoprotein
MLFLILVGAITGCEMPGDRLVTISGQTMGTTFQVKIVRGEAALDVEMLDREINARLVEVNRQMSTYRDDSEISQFNRSRTTDWVGISSDFAYVLSVAHELSTWSDGAFDITFGPDVVPERVPAADSIAVRMAWTGYGKIDVSRAKSAVKKAVPEVYCDLSAVAKGFGVDRVASYLDSLGMGHYFIEIGGEVRAKGENHFGHLWRVGIASPLGRGGVTQALSMRNQSMATSGDYHNYFGKDGVRYSHTIDPRTGRPITHRLVSVSVVHESCAYADGLATAINVMGPEKGLAFAEERNLAVFMVVRNGEEFVEVMTSEFGELLKNQ